VIYFVGCGPFKVGELQRVLVVAVAISEPIGASRRPFNAKSVKTVALGGPHLFLGALLVIDELFLSVCHFFTKIHKLRPPNTYSQP